MDLETQKRINRCVDMIFNSEGEKQIRYLSELTSFLDGYLSAKRSCNHFWNLIGGRTNSDGSGATYKFQCDKCGAEKSKKTNFFSWNK